ncbi:MAG: sigma-70 family RNA polymerase sigma factor [Candidatus Moranbacteria bacterium]|nr:sigma-70 family RNA polymerase sigma factor [Candidatus Moranbacteria bacterium]
MFKEDFQTPEPNPPDSETSPHQTKGEGKGGEKRKKRQDKQRTTNFECELIKHLQSEYYIIKQEAQEQFYKQYFPYVYNIILRKLNFPPENSKKRWDAEDLAQEIMKKAMLNISNFKQKSKLTTWLHTIASNHFSNYIRAQERKKRQSEHRILDDMVTPDPAKTFEAFEAKDLLGKFYQSLTNNQEREIIEYLIQGLQQNEIAEKMHLQPSTISTKIKIITKKFKEFLELQNKTLPN